MKKLFFYTPIIIFSFTSLFTIFSFTSIDKKSDKGVVKQNTASIENTTRSASNEAPAAESEALTIVDNTSSTSGIPANLPSGGYRPAKDIVARAIYGVASYYHNMFNGRQTSNGEIFSQQKLTGASKFLPLNEWVRVTNLDNGKSVVVKITDRTHPRIQRVIDLSKSAAKQLAYLGNGLAKVKISRLGKNKPAA